MAFKKVLVIQHVECEGLGIIEAPLRRAGFAPEFIKVFRGQGLPRTAQGYSAVIALGGPMGVYEEDIHPFISAELRLIESVLRSGLPFLGVCLGSQMLARAAGARVYKGKGKEIGWYKVRLTIDGMADRLFLGFPEEFTVFQWHGDTFDVPPGAVNLASSEMFPNQLIRVGRNAYGVQFHLEVTGDMIKDWIEVNGRELEALKGVIDPGKIVEETPRNVPDLLRYGNTAVERFLRAID
ncbi:MAG: hypothetical protein HZB22_00595 [Deltaproteobacteria bacterium]|nr:hypothetical protein [Deltaproteobacteria bacterium]